VKVIEDILLGNMGFNPFFPTDFVVQYFLQYLCTIYPSVLEKVNNQQTNNHTFWSKTVNMMFVSFDTIGGS